MRYLSNLLILLALIGCAETKTDLSGNTPLKINDFNAAFKNIDLPIRINDTNLVAFTDTIKIGRKALAQFLPDSVVDVIAPKLVKNSSIFTVGKIEKETEYYLLLNNKDAKKQTVSVIAFSKKNVFLGYQILTQFDLTALATATTQFSGAEIEQIVVAGLYSAEAQQTQLTQAHLLTEISNTQPLAVVRAESIAQLRQWAENRTVSAD
jgi:SpoVK/Ycf46/Vps4 family AAA+-type ATPase